MPDSGITVEEAPPRSVAGIGAFRDQAGVLAALRAEFGADVPVACRSVRAGGVALSCLAPGRFLASGAREAGLPGRLADRLAGLAAITDQSDMWAVFVVSGAAAREVLARVVPVDIGDEQFRQGHVALTRAGHVDVRLWRSEGQTYEIAATRSFAPDLLHALRSPDHRPGAT